MSTIEKAIEKAGKSDYVANKGSAKPVVDQQEQPSFITAEHEIPLEQGEKLDQQRIGIDFAAFAKLGMLVPGEENPLTEEYRMIKRPLLLNAFGVNEIKHSNLILVTSSMPGEGKTFTAINLALSIAMERDKTVLLVDADIAKSSIASVFNIESKHGLLDILEDDQLEFSDILVKTEIANLGIIPAGRRHKHSTEILASDAMIRFTDELSSRYPDRIVIFDSPPLLAATESAVLASHVGQIVFVIESENTPQYVVRQALSKIQSCEVIGCVLNKVKHGFSVGYYYGYKYDN